MMDTEQIKDYDYRRGLMSIRPVLSAINHSIRDNTDNHYFESDSISFIEREPYNVRRKHAH